MRGDIQTCVSTVIAEDADVLLRNTLTTLMYTIDTHAHRAVLTVWLAIGARAEDLVPHLVRDVHEARAHRLLERVCEVGRFHYVPRLCEELVHCVYVCMYVCMRKVGRQCKVKWMER